MSTVLQQPEIHDNSSTPFLPIPNFGNATLQPLKSDPYLGPCPFFPSFFPQQAQEVALTP